jgi:hypothetical protein
MRNDRFRNRQQGLVLPAGGKILAVSFDSAHNLSHSEPPHAAKSRETKTRARGAGPSALIDDLFILRLSAHLDAKLRHFVDDDRRQQAVQPNCLPLKAANVLAALVRRWPPSNHVQRWRPREPGASATGAHPELTHLPCWPSVAGPQSLHLAHWSKLPDKRVIIFATPTAFHPAGPLENIRKT